jgi:hypothetical protein
MLRLDSVGIGGFSHDFGTLRGKRSGIAEVFDSFGKFKPTIFQILLLVFGTVFPILARIPTPRKNLVKKFKLTVEDISREILETTRREKEGIADGTGDNSIIGLLSMYSIHLSLFSCAGHPADSGAVKASNDNSELHMSEDEVIAQVSSNISNESMGLRCVRR